MPSATKKEHLQATAQVLQQALVSYPGTIPEIAERIGKSPATLHLWSKGYHAVSPQNARALAKVLGIDPRTIVSGPNGHGGARKRQGRPKGSLNRATSGPAARAVALLEAREPVLTLPAINGVQGASRRPPGGVFRMEVRDNGTMAIWVQTEYPIDKGTQFVRWLLDFGLMPAPPDPSPTG